MSHYRRKKGLVEFAAWFQDLLIKTFVTGGSSVAVGSSQPTPRSAAATDRLPATCKHGIYLWESCAECEA